MIDVSNSKYTNELQIHKIFVKKYVFHTLKTQIVKLKKLELCMCAFKYYTQHLIIYSMANSRMSASIFFIDFI